jgi:predicted transcriptional regulator
MKTYVRILLIAVFLLVACQKQDIQKIPSTQPDVRGNITNLKKTNSKKKEGVAEVLVEAVEGVETNHTKASLRIDNKTLIEGLDGSTLRPEQLQEGQMVEAWFEDPVMESYPVQAHAAAVRVSN